MIPELRGSPRDAPQRRFRGKRRYFARVLREAEAFEIPVFEGGWATWHYHADWPGWSNLRWQYREQHLVALTVVFRKILQRASALPMPFQTWIYLSGRDAGEDAVYLHSPNTHGEPYPLEFTPPGPVWGEERLRPLFARLLPGRQLRIGRFKAFDQWAEPPRNTCSFYVQVPGIGAPL